MKEHRLVLISFIILVLSVMVVGCAKHIDLAGTAAPASETATITSERTITPSPPVASPEVGMEETVIPTVTLSADNSNQIYWRAGFETGDLREYDDYLGEFLRQSQFGSYQITSSIARNGNYSAALTIDTSRLSAGQAAAAYLAFYDNPAEAYYSGWIFIPETVTPQSWWNIWQWKSTYNGNSDDSLPMWVLDLTRIDGNSEELRLTLVYRADSNDLKVSYTNAAAVIPKGEWVHISTYYVKSPDNDGRVGVWINGEEVFFIENAHTTLSDNTLYWLVNNYSLSIQPSPTTIYFYDMVISHQRIDPTGELP